MSKKADQIDAVRAQMAASYAAKQLAKPIVDMDERGRIAEEQIARKESGGVVRIALDLLDDSLHQNRVIYPEDEIDTLADTMRTGQLSPLRVRKKDNGRFEVLAGHRRKRAAKKLQWLEVDCVVVVCTELEAARDVIADNESHKGVSDFERAKGYQHLIDLGMSQADVARAVGVSRVLISNRMKFLSLPAPVLAALELNPACMSYRWVPKLLEAMTSNEGAALVAAKRIEDSANAAADGPAWSMPTLLDELTAKVAAGKVPAPAPVARPAKLSITNSKNKEILTVQRDPKRPGVFELRIMASHPFSQDELEQHLAQSLKTAWGDTLGD